MPKKEAPLDVLHQYLPAGAVGEVISFMRFHRIHLTISRKRKTILGDYRHPASSGPHRISINGNLNPYAFLITLIHEMAHLIAFQQHGPYIPPHGKQWKNIYAKLLLHFIRLNVFPQDVQSVLLKIVQNPSAGTAGEEKLLRVLRKYDQKQATHTLLEDLPFGSFFCIENNRLFQKMEKLRKRFKCLEVKTGKYYLFSPVYEVIPVSKPEP
ncbi:MAG: SprT-like domain-containing protein [Chitinophagaceae bacterium]|nr:SprT-like domain-containing protein [Chitinophagaceae bacterium]